MKTPQAKQTSPALGVATGSASEAVAKLPDGFYFFKDPDFPGIWGIIARLEGRTWRIGEARPMPDNDWDDGVTFYPALSPNGRNQRRPAPDTKPTL